MEESERYQKLAEGESLSCRGIEFSNAVAYSCVEWTVENVRTQWSDITKTSNQC